MKLNPRQRKFVAEYLIDFNGTQAAIRAGYPPASAGNHAFTLLTKTEINEAIENRIEEQLDLAELSVQWVLRQWKQIAEANPGELCWTEVECCHYCYGLNHLYQWIESEYLERVQMARSHVCGKVCRQPCGAMVPPDNSGGFGFTSLKPPAVDCPRCNGKGVERVRIADTRHLKGSARRLYAGVKQTKDGIEIKMRDQDAALMNISKYFGMLLDRKEISGPGGGPIPLSLENIDVKDLTDAQIIQLIQQRALLAPETIEGVVT